MDKNNKFVIISVAFITLLLLAAGVLGTLMMLSIINETNPYAVLFMICIGWVADFCIWHMLMGMLASDWED